VALAIKQELDEAKSLGVTGSDPRSLDDVMETRAISPAQAAQMPDVGLDELFAAGAN
jgi:hypothetical protein